MSHEVETMAYNKAEVPWHGLGVPVEADLTPLQILEKAGCDWNVNMKPAFIELDGVKVDINRSALMRSSDNKILDIVPNDWKPVQNLTAFEFFNDWVAAGEMSMETAGSLRGGKLVWALAKINESFDLFGTKDHIDSYLMFVNPHLYGYSTSVSENTVRTVCMNTLRLSLSTNKSDKIIRVNHRSEFNADEVKETIGVAKDKLAKYKTAAEFLSKKKAKDEDVVEYFKRIFPVLTSKSDSEKDESKAVKMLKEIVHTQPGADFADGTWWNAFNAVTFYTDHKYGKEADKRLDSAWFGENKNKKIQALQVATEFATAA